MQAGCVQLERVAGCATPCFRMCSLVAVGRIVYLKVIRFSRRCWIMISLARIQNTGLVSALLLILNVAYAHAQQIGPLASRVFGNGTSNLIFVLHGDLSDGSPADYHQSFAREVSEKIRNATVVAIVRPGYADSRGLKSPGSNNGKIDQYTKTNNDLVAATIDAFRKSVKPQRVVAVGHSGGAAQVGAIIGRFPGLIDSAVLVSCPCDIQAWRSSNNRSPWPNSQSPADFLKSVPKQTRIVAITGQNDSNTRPSLARSYVEQASALGLSAQALIVNGGHGFNSISRDVLKSVVGLAR